MITLINNDLRVFQVVYGIGLSVFCILIDLNKVVKEKNLQLGSFKIYHFWNTKPQRVTKRYLKEMMLANQIKQEFKY